MDWLTYWNIYNFFKRRKKVPKVAIEQYTIAENHLYGRGVSQNSDKAAEWFRLSAEQNCLTSTTLSAWRQLSWPHVLFHGFTALLFLSVTPAFQFNDGGVMNETVDRRHGHHVVREDSIPFTERLV